MIFNDIFTILYTGVVFLQKNFFLLSVVRSNQKKQKARKLENFELLIRLDVELFQKLDNWILSFYRVRRTPASFYFGQQFTDVKVTTTMMHQTFGLRGKTIIKVFLEIVLDFHTKLLKTSLNTVKKKVSQILWFIIEIFIRKIKEKSFN